METLNPSGYWSWTTLAKLPRKNIFDQFLRQNLYFLLKSQTVCLDASLQLKILLVVFKCFTSLQTSLSHSQSRKTYELSVCQKHTICFLMGRMHLSVLKFICNIFPGMLPISYTSVSVFNYSLGYLKYFFSPPKKECRNPGRLLGWPRSINSVLNFDLYHIFLCSFQLGFSGVMYPKRLENLHTAQILACLYIK